MIGAPPGSLAQRIAATPRITPSRALQTRLNELTSAEPNGDLADLVKDAKVERLVSGLAQFSPFLWRTACADTLRLARLLRTAPEASLTAMIAGLSRDCALAADDAALMRLLRKARQETALLIALADLGGLWSVEEVTRALTRSADAFVQIAMNHIVRTAWPGARPTGDDPASACGLVILALGKQGAGELNYSSDVDLIVLYDPASTALAGFEHPAAALVRQIQRFVRFLQERTPDGYVLRVDLRLRPDPASTSIVISLPAAFAYYESVGQNWERAALIKARPVAGDLALGEGFLRDLAPFIWRKYFDYGAIADIHAMKRQIHAVRGHADVAVAGHDIKLGRGGIREIEFFVQTQQLIFGGRRPDLRGPRTLDMLTALQRDGWVTPDAVTELSAAYRFLRAIEHRLQMINDEQTQRLPTEAKALQSFARFCGYSGAAAFAKAMTGQLRLVEKHYARLFEHAPGLDGAAGNLVFTGVTDDPETLATLRKLGFREPARAIETVRGWHFGRRAAVQTPRAREVLTDLAPRLIDAFAHSGDPDAALANFDLALARMPAAIELFSLLKQNQKLLELFSDILGGAPRLARLVAARPHLLDAAIDPAVGAADKAEPRVTAYLALAMNAEDFLDRARAVAQEEMFAIGVRLLAARITPDAAALAYTALAETLVREMLRHCEAVMALEYGRVPGARCIVLAMGKLGSREMTATSDLDLILIYDFNDAASESDGPRRLHAVTWYARLTQRLVSALTIATRHGQLYEVDLRLRPSGGKGPLATQARTFLQYQRQEAETWEHMALTRARCVAGDVPLGRAIERATRAILRRRRDPGRLARDIAAMRRLVTEEKGDGPGDLKLAAGGLLDIEFIEQYFILRHAADEPSLALPGNRHALWQALALGVINSDAAYTLIAARALYSATIQMERLTLETPFDPARAGEGVQRRIAAAAGLPDFARLTLEIAETRLRVREIFSKILP